LHTRAYVGELVTSEAGEAHRTLEAPTCEGTESQLNQRV